MFFCLRHPAFLFRDHQKREIDRPDSGDHVADEVFVTGDIDNADVKFFATLSVKIQFGEAEIDSNAARLFFGQAVRIGPGQRLDERTLAVIDVAGGGENEIYHRAVQALRIASITRSSWCGRIVRKSSLSRPPLM